jgi:hypothetical protein
VAVTGWWPEGQKKAPLARRLEKITPRWMLFDVGFLGFSVSSAPQDADTAVHRVLEM